MLGLACLAGALMAQQAGAVTFATFSLPTGTPLGFQILPGGTFSSINVGGDQAVLNWVNQGALAGTSTAAYLTVSGSLTGVASTPGGSILQDFADVTLLFTDIPSNQLGAKVILRVEAVFGSLLSSAPYESAGASSTAVVFSSDLPVLDDGGGGGDLNTLFNQNRATAFNLNDLNPVASIGGGGSIDPFVANIAGSFSAVPEPTGLLGLGLASGLMLLARRRK